VTGPAPILLAQGLQVRRGGVQILDVPELALQAGAVLALIGPNGSGKSTLLKTLACLLEPEAGALISQGRPLTTRAAQDAYRRQVTMVFQDPLLFDATVRSNLEAGLRFHGVPASARRTRVVDVAHHFGLEHLLERSARKLSGGEAQRTSLARAFALRPSILFLDEPFSALDPKTREALVDDLAVALKQTRTTAVFATHDQMEALRLADTLAVLHQGRIVQEGPAADVINHPADAFVADFVGMETLLTGQVSASEGGVFRVSVGGQEVVALGQARLREEILVGVRPEHVTLSVQGETLSSARNAFPSTVTRIVPMGPYFKVELDCGFFLTAFVTAFSLEELHLAPGRQVLATFKATSVHVIRNQGSVSQVTKS
jgi:tungstate transport system ATP-binding protein